MVDHGGGGDLNGRLSKLGNIGLELLQNDARPTILLDLNELTATSTSLTPAETKDISDAFATVIFRRAILLENDAFKETLGCSSTLPELARIVFSEACPKSLVVGGWQCSTMLLGESRRIRAVLANELSTSGYLENSLPTEEHPRDNSSWKPAYVGNSITSRKKRLPNRRLQNEESQVGNPTPLELSVIEVEDDHDACGNVVSNAYPEHFNDELPDPNISLLPQPNLDWTADDFVPLPGFDADHYYNLRAVDWAKTPLGPPSVWDTILLTHATSVMTNAYPTALYWGPEYTILYNQHWKAIAQNKNPVILGKPFAAGWPELDHYFRPILDRAYHKGEKTTKEAECLFIKGRTSVPYEETYFNFIVCPTIGKHGKPVAVLEQAFEITRDYVSNRRMAFLRKMGDCLANVGDLHKGEFLTLVLDAFKDDQNIHKDSPFMSIYKVVDPEENDCHLVGTIGLPVGGYLAPTRCILNKGGHSPGCGYFSREMEQAMLSGRCVLKELDTDVMDGVEYRGFNEPSRYAVIIPIQATMNVMQGFLILGINPRRPFDNDYKFWIDLLRKEFASTSGKARLLMEEIRKGIDAEVREAERKQAIETKKLLELRTEELRSSELRFTKTAEILPIGLTLMDPNGVVLFTNDSYHELTTLPQPTEGLAQMNWRKSIYKDDAERVYSLFDNAIASRSSIQYDCRCGNDYEERGWKYWVSCNMVVHIDQTTGELTGYMMTLVDVTSIKLAEEYQKELSLHAVERRRQQENFIDIFSHELRNPFSATLQCADGILSSVMDFQLTGGTLDLEDIIDAASTILVCVQHQMRIIDDVLTLSKLDSMLLSVVPIDVQIHESVVRTFKIFQSELQVKDIKATFEIGEMYDFLKVSWLKCDPSRFNQILVNLLTNAIKFTSLQRGPREVSVRLDAARHRPARIGRITFPHGQEDLDLDCTMTGSEWGTGEPVYILVTVKDSGIGISEKWQTKLFNRFEQVPKTHVTYGGSGLGLFICRKLCRIQGGEIGVYSEEGKGSTFAFYIQARRTNPPLVAQQGPPKQRQPPATHIRDMTIDTPVTSPSPLSLESEARPKSTRGGSFPLTTVDNPHVSSNGTLSPLLPSPRPTPSINIATGEISRSQVMNQSMSETFVPHTSATSACQATLSHFKPIKSPSIQPVPRGTTVKYSYRILIVEDNLINQEVLRRQLRKEGCVAHVANNGQEGLDFIANSSFAVKGGTEIDIVLMDMEMPIMDGNTATRKIRELEEEGRFLKHVPIMGISANARREQVSEMTKAGMDDAISKPFRIVDLLRRFNLLMEKLEGSVSGSKDENENESDHGSVIGANGEGGDYPEVKKGQRGTPLDLSPVRILPLLPSPDIPKAIPTKERSEMSIDVVIAAARQQRRYS